MERLLVPFDEGREQLGDIGRTKTYDLVKKGRLKLVKIGLRSFLTADSIRDVAQNGG